MRKILQVLLVAALALGVVACVSGWALAHSQRETLAQGVTRAPAPMSSMLGAVHALCSHCAALAAGGGAAVLFVLALQRLLEPRGRRLAAAMLFVLAPLLMAFTLAAEGSAYLDWTETAMGRLQLDPFEDFLNLHGRRWAPLMLGAVALSTVLAAWTFRRGAGEREHD